MRQNFEVYVIMSVFVGWEVIDILATETPELKAFIAGLPVKDVLVRNIRHPFLQTLLHKI